MAAPGASAAETKPAAQPTVLTQDQMDHAVEVFSIMASALRSDKVPDDVKSRLMSCIYSVSLGEISSHVDQLIAANAGKIDRKDPDSLLGAIAGVCGYKPSDAPAAAAPAAKPPQGGVVGR